MCFRSKLELLLIHILISDNNLLIIGEVTNSSISVDFQIAQLSDTSHLKIPVNIFELCFRPQEASWI